MGIILEILAEPTIKGNKTKSSISSQAKSQRKKTMGDCRASKNIARTVTVLSHRVKDLTDSKHESWVNQKLVDHTFYPPNHGLATQAVLSTAANTHPMYWTKILIFLPTSCSYRLLANNFVTFCIRVVQRAVPRPVPCIAHSVTRSPSCPKKINSTEHLLKVLRLVNYRFTDFLLFLS